jgi:cytochrome c oxidase subunit 2
MIAQDRRFIGVSGLSATAAAAIMSALQQSPIYGLEELEIPLSRRGPPGISRRGTRPAKPVASYRGSSPWQLARSWGFCARGCCGGGYDTISNRGAGRGMKALSRLAAIAASAGGVLASAGAAWAGLGQPTPWQMDLQDSASPVMQDVADFHTFLLWVIAVICAVVLGLLLTCIVRFNARANPTPSRTTHNTPIEIIWTIVPVIILALIAVPSFRLLFVQTQVPTPDLTVKVTGKQWFWSYSYPDNGNFEFNSLMVQDKDLKPGQPRLLAVDNEMVVPINKIVHVLVTGADVIHSFAVPSFGIRMDAIPGRVNETWFKATIEGVFYGQCSELCGKDHAFMPIAVRVVNEGDFNTWLNTAKQKYAIDNDAAHNALAATAAPAIR